MKKILLLMVLIFCINIKAKNYGIDYMPIENLDLKTEEIKKYHFYKENKINAYFIEGENPNIFKKTSDYYYSDYSEWQKEKPNLKKNRIIEERNVYVYQQYKKVKNIKIEVDAENESILEFAFLVNNFSVNNTSFCNECSENYYMYTSDHEYNRAFKIKNLSLSLNEYYLPSEIKFRIMFNTEGIRYRIFIYEDNFSNVTYEKEFTSDLELHEYDIKDFDIKYDSSENFIKYEEDNKMMLKETYKEYSYKDKYYLYEYIMKDYYPTYEISLDGYIKDENDFIIEKKYYYLENATIKDKILITTENYDLKDYIKTTLPFETSSNIDISKNGNYKIKYIFPNKTIEKDVQVKTNNEYIKSLEEGISKKNDEIKEVISNKNEIIDRLENSLKTKDEIISKKTVERVVKKENPIPIILITIGAMSIVFCVILSIRKNVELK